MRRKVTYFLWNILAGRAKNVTARRFFRAMPKQGRRHALDESPTQEGQVADKGKWGRRPGFSSCHGLFRQIEQISDFSRDDTVRGAREVIFFRTVVEVGQAVIVPAFRQEVADARAYFEAGTRGNAVVELVVHGLVVLLHFDGCLLNDVSPVARLRVRISYEEGDLRARVDEELHAPVFAES